MKKKAIKVNRIQGYEIERDRKDDIMVSVFRFNRCNTHYHRQIEIVLSHSNNLSMEIDQHNLILKRGDVIIAHSYCLHKYDTNKFSSVICVPIKYTALVNKIENASGAYTLIKKAKNSKKILRAMKNLKGFEKKNTYKQDALFYHLLGELSDALIEKTSVKKVGGNDISFKIIEYINLSFTENINLESLAEHCGYSKNYISTVFNTNFKCNFKEYLNMRRLQAFVERQSLYNETITDSASAVGFNSPRTFFNAFKEHYKMTPKEYLALKK